MMVIKDDSKVGIAFAPQITMRDGFQNALIAHAAMQTDHDVAKGLHSNIIIVCQCSNREAQMPVDRLAS